jgi:hypothetical protein
MLLWEEGSEDRPVMRRDGDGGDAEDAEAPVTSALARGDR